MFDPSHPLLRPVLAGGSGGSGGSKRSPVTLKVARVHAKCRCRWWQLGTFHFGACVMVSATLFPPAATLFHVGLCVQLKHQHLCVALNDEAQHAHPHPRHKDSSLTSLPLTYVARQDGEPRRERRLALASWCPHTARRGLLGFGFCGGAEGVDVRARRGVPLHDAFGRCCNACRGCWLCGVV